METKFSEQESLSLISEMIEQARNNFRKGSGNGMIYNGFLVSASAILNIALIFAFAKWGVNVYFSFWIWLVMIPGAYIGHLINRKVKQKSLVKTHIDSIIGTMWNGFGISIYTLLAVIFIIGFWKKFYEVLFLINPAILVLIGLAEFVTAKACRFKPYLHSAIVMWVGALVCAVAVVLWVWEPVIIQLFILTICMIFGFVIPGYQLNKVAKKDV